MGSIGVLCLALAGCGAADRARMERNIAEMRAELKAMKDGHQAQSQRLERLGERLGVIEARLEARAAMIVPRELPVVRLDPEDVEAARASDDRPPRTITQADLDRMAGSGLRARRAGPRRPVPPPANAALAGNIGVVPIGLTPGGAAGGPLVDDPLPAYREARRYFEAGKMGQAKTAFEAFVRRWPAHSYTDNALYWLGQVHFARAELPQALAAFKQVVTKHPSGNKLPDALFMIGRTLRQLGQGDEGRETLGRLVSMYPESEAARKARAFLETPAGGM